MSVVNGQVANQTTFNAAFMSRIAVSTSTLAIVQLLNTDIASGATVLNTQALLNKLVEGVGTTGIGDTNINNYANNNYVVDGDTRKVAIEKLDAQLFTTQADLDTAEVSIAGHEARVTNLESNPMTIGGAKTFSGNVIVSGNFTVQGTTTYINSTDLQVVDKAILVNKDGNDASADMGAGIEVKRTTDDGSIHFDSTLTSKWKLGILSSMYEVLVSGLAQTIAGAKTFTSAISMSAQKIIDLADPTNLQDAATKAYVDASVGAAPTSGTWVPEIKGATTAGAGTYTTRSGSWHRRDNILHFTCYILYSAHTGTGDAYVDGLPFASTADADTYHAVATYFASLTLSALNTLTPYVDTNSTVIKLTQTPVGGGAASSTSVDAGGGELMLTGWYRI